MSLLMHRGGEYVKKGDLDLIPMPEATESYVPVSHYHLADKFLTISQDILRDYTLIGENYGIARQGNQLFGILNFRNGNSDLGLSVAFRNSYDKSMSVGLAIGSSVFVCDNLALHGDIAIMKKHTKNIWTELENLAITTLYKATKTHEQTFIDRERLQGIQMNDRQAFELMGYMFGQGIISPRQITVVKDEWLKPGHEEFQLRNRWSYLNAVTEALKSCPLISIMERHIEAYNTVIDI